MGMERSTATHRRFLLGLLAFAMLTLLVERWFGIRFETNDDVAMMMMAHGFGIAGQPTPLLLFSNVWQGLAIQAMGWPFGLSGYGVYLMGAQVVAMAAIFAFLTELNGRVRLNLAVVIAVGIRAVFAPQFTVIAGFLALATVLAMLAYLARPRVSVLAAATVLGLASILMRDHLFLFVAAVALPFLLRPALVQDRRVWAAGVILLLLALAAQWHQNLLLSAPEWTAHHAQNLLRAAFTDFNAAPRVAADPKALAAAGWSLNDLSMVENWWLVDTRLSSPDAMRAALEVVGLPAFFGLSAARLSGLMAQFAEADMLAVISLLLVASIWLRGTALVRLSLGVFLLVGLALFLTAGGRLGVSRIYYPPLVVLACVAVAMLPRAPQTALPLFPEMVITVAALGAMVFSLGYRVPQALDAAEAVRESEAVLSRKADPARVYVVWGGALPFEWLYRPLALREEMPKLRLYGLGASSLAPWAVAQIGGSPDAVIQAFRSAEGLPLITSSHLTPLLRAYCAERFGGTLDVEYLARTSRFDLDNVRCGPSKLVRP